MREAASASRSRTKYADQTLPSRAVEIPRRYLPKRLKSVRGKPRSDSPMMTTMSTKEKARPAHPRTLRAKNNHFRGTFSEFSRTVEGLRRTCEDIYLPSGRRCGVPIRFSWMIPCSQSRAVRSLSSRRYLTEGSRKKRLQKLKQPDRLYARSRLGRARAARSLSRSIVYECEIVSLHL